MVECDVPLKRKHCLPDYLYWNLVASVPIVTALITILKCLFSGSSSMSS